VNHRTRTIIAACLLVATLAPAGVFCDPDAERGRTGATVGDLRERGDDDEHGKESPSPFGPFLELVGGVLIVAVAGGLLVYFYRRFGGGMKGLRGSRAIEVLGRTALSPRHAVCLLKVGRRLVLVGMAGDRIAPISVIDQGDEVADILRQLGASDTSDDAITDPTAGGERCG